MTNKVLLFDLDGTLIDSTDAIVESFELVFAQNNKPAPSAGEIKALIGHPLDAMFLELNAPKERVEAWVAEYREHYRRICTLKTTMLPFGIDALKEASGFGKLGVVTTKLGHYSKILLEHFGVLGLFEIVVGREDVTQPKPHPEPIFKAMEAFDKDSRFFMIGDTLLDMEAAKGAGITPIGVSCGYQSREVLESSGARVFDNTLEAVLAIKNL